jgi:hypothetical protein
MLGEIGSKTIRDTRLRSYRQPQYNGSRIIALPKFPSCYRYLGG